MNLSGSTRPSRVWVIASCLGALLCSARAATIAGTVVVVDLESRAAGVDITLTRADGSAAAQARSDVRGAFALAVADTGTFRVEARFAGYEDAVRTVRLPDDDGRMLDLRLLPRRYRVDEVVVVASRRPEAGLGATASVAGYDWRELADDAAGPSYASLLRGARGIDYAQTGVLHERFSSRGFNSALNTRLLMLVDGRVTKLTNGAGTPLYNTPVPKSDLQDMEVVVGPGSALYGPDAASGVVSLRTKDPRDFPGTQIDVAAGSHRAQRARLRHAEAGGRWGWKVAGEVQSARDYASERRYLSADGARSVGDDPDRDGRVWNVAGGIYYYPDALAKTGLSAGRVSMSLIAPINTGRTQVADWTYDYLQWTYDSPRWYASVYRAGDDTGDSFPLHSRAQYQLAGLSQVEAEDRALFRGSSSMWDGEVRYRWQPPQLGALDVGVNLRHEALQSAVVVGRQAAVRQGGAYVHGGSQPRPWLRLIYASRVDWHSEYAMQVSPKAALVVTPRADVALRLSYNRAFRSPTLTDQFLALPVGGGLVARGNHDGFRFATADGSPLPAAFAAGVPALEPEENRTLEAGARAVLGGRLLVDATAFRSRYRDFISPLRPIGDAAAGIVTVDEAGAPRVGEATLTYLNFGWQTVRGLEAGADLAAGPRLSLSANGYLMDAGELTDAQGLKQPLNSPTLRLNAAAAVRDLGREGLRLAPALRYVRAFDYLSGVHVGPVPSYLVFDLDASCAYKGATYRLGVTNVLDERHLEFVSGPRIGRVLLAEVSTSL